MKFFALLGSLGLCGGSLYLNTTGSSDWGWFLSAGLVMFLVTLLTGNKTMPPYQRNAERYEQYLNQQADAQINRYRNQ